MASKPKAKKPAGKKKSSKVTNLKPRDGAGIGHNGQINKPLAQIFANYASMDEDKKQISKAQRDLRAKAKEEHGIDKGVFAHEVRMMKMDKDKRVMFEQGHADLKNMLGYQFALKLNAEDSEEGDDDQDGGEAAAAAAAAAAG